MEVLLYTPALKEVVVKMGWKVDCGSDNRQTHKERRRNDTARRVTRKERRDKPPQGQEDPKAG